MDTQFASFIVLSIVISIAPGPGNIYVVSYSLRYGTKAGLVSTLGITAGCLIVVFIAALGVFSLLELYPGVISIIQIMGGLYVLYLSIVMWPRASVDNDDQNISTEVLNKTQFNQGAINGILNPVDTIFYAVVVPTFIPTDISGNAYQIYYLFLAIIDLTISFSTKCFFSVFAGFSREQFFSRNASVLNLFSAALLGCLGVFLVGKSGLTFFA